MSSLSEIPLSSQEGEQVLAAKIEPLETIFAVNPEGLVPAGQLPPAASVLAEIFPPDDQSAQDDSRESEVSLPLSFADIALVPPAVVDSAAPPDSDSQLPESALLFGQGSFGDEPIPDSKNSGPLAVESVQAPSNSDVSADVSVDDERTENAPLRKGSVFRRLLKSVSAVFAREAKRRNPDSASVALDAAPSTDESEHAGANESATATATSPVEDSAAPTQDQVVEQLAIGAEPPAEKNPNDQGFLPAQSESPEAALEDRVANIPAIAPLTGSPNTRDEKISRDENLPSIDRDKHSTPGDLQVSFNGAASEPSRVGDLSSPESPFDSSSAADSPFQTEDETDEVDPADDDAAIASAIDRYANLTDPARTKETVYAENHETRAEPQQAVPEKTDLNAILGIPRDSEPAESLLGYTAPSIQVPDIEELPVPFPSAVSPAAERISTKRASQNNNAVERELGQQTSGVGEGIGEAPASMPGATAPTSTNIRDWSFEEKLGSHHEWIESKGASGRRIDLAAADLEGSDLIGVNLRYMDLHDANLRAADLLMADLRDACLVRANFRDSCLVGANLEGANLEGAALETSMGLVPRQLAGANLHEATLPPQILFESLAEFRRASRAVYAYFVALLSLCAFSWLAIWTTRDFQLLTNASVIPFLHSPAAAAALPTVQFYLIAPFALFIVYLVFNFHLQHLWDLVLELPAVFPDGRALGENEPRIVVGLMRAHFRWMNQDTPSARVVEKAISVLAAYWIVPATLLFYWLRFLTLQEIHGTVLQELLVIAACGVALYCTTKVGRPAAKWLVQENVVERLFSRFREINPVTTALVLLGVLTFLSAGTMLGVPHGKDRAPQFMAGSVRRWAPAVLWSVGIDPYADLTEAAISTKPANWNGSDQQLAAVKGARLNSANFRYAQAYRAFLANAHLLHANFQGAFLSQADFRGADLGQSNLRYATLDQALMSRANLDRAMLDGANLSRSDLRASNLSYASLAGATLVDARLDGATLYGAKLPSSTLIRTNFEKADLRESHLEAANLEHVDLQGAYLWSAKLAAAHLNNAQLGNAIFVDADLRGADLRWAQLSGTVLTGADLTGALLDGTDFRGAVGFGANQVCSAKSRHGLLLDDAMQAQVVAYCGAGN